MYVDGHGPYCMIIDRDTRKDDPFDSVKSNNSETELCWLASDCIDIKKGSTVQSGNLTFKLRESPVNQHDGWYCAMLMLTCEC